jgi:4-hydroxybenzoate polyprenyltransferase
VLIIVCVAFGMILAGMAASNAYDRAIDAVNNPHIEGF